MDLGKSFDLPSLKKNYLAVTRNFGIEKSFPLSNAILIIYNLQTFFLTWNLYWFVHVKLKEITNILHSHFENASYKPGRCRIYIYGVASPSQIWIELNHFFNEDVNSRESIFSTLTLSDKNVCIYNKKLSHSLHKNRQLLSL